MQYVYLTVLTKVTRNVNFRIRVRKFSSRATSSHDTCHLLPSIRGSVVTLARVN